MKLNPTQSFLRHFHPFLTRYSQNQVQIALPLFIDPLYSSKLRKKIHKWALHLCQHVSFPTTSNIFALCHWSFQTSDLLSLDATPFSQRARFLVSISSHEQMSKICTFCQLGYHYEYKSTPTRSIVDQNRISSRLYHLNSNHDPLLTLDFQLRGLIFKP